MKEGKSEETIGNPQSAIANVIILPSGIEAEVDFGCLTGKDEDQLGDEKKLHAGEAFDPVLAKVVKRLDAVTAITPDTILDLLSGDRSALLLALRISRHGETVEFKGKCQYCGAEAKYEFSLADIKNTPYPNGNQREFEITLPASGKKAVVAAFTGRMEKEMLKVKEKSVHSPIITALRELDGKKAEYYNLTRKWIWEMDVRDTAALRKILKENRGGPDFSTSYKCEDWKCGRFNETNFLLMPSFLSPGSI